MENSNFQIKNGKLLKYLGNEEKVIIPEGVSVIGREAFNDALLVKVIALPSTLKGVEEGVITTNTYGYNYQIEKVVIDSLDHWLNIDFGGQGSNFMSKNTKLYIGDELAEDIVIPGHIKAIKQFAFCGCQSLKKVVIQEGVEIIENGAFAFSSLEEIVLPNTIIKFGNEKKTYGFQEGSFHRCQNLKEITIPTNVKELPPFLLEGCASLKTINLHKGLERIHHTALDGLKSLEVVNLPEGLKEFGISLTGKVKEIQIPSSVIKISGFYTKGIKDVYFPDGIKIIEKLSLNGPETIRLPRTLEKLVVDKSISYAKGDSKLITTVQFNAYEGGYYLGNEDNPYLALIAIDHKACQKEFVIHKNCKIITGSVFFGDSPIEVVHLPKDIRFVDKMAFYGSQALKKIINPGNYDLEKDKCIVDCPNLERELKGLRGKQINIVNRIDKEDSEIEEKYQVVLLEDESSFDTTFQTKLIYHRKQTYKDGRKVTQDIESLYEMGVSRAGAIDIFERLKKNNLEIIDINELDNETLFPMLFPLNDVLVNSYLYDLRKHMKATPPSLKNKLEQNYLEELEKYSDEELDTLLMQADDIEYEKIRLVKLLRSKMNRSNGGDNDGLFQ